MRFSLFAICLAVTAAPAERALNPTFESATPLSAQSPIDARVFDRLQRLDIPPAPPRPPPPRRARPQSPLRERHPPPRPAPHRRPRLRPPPAPRHPARPPLL